MINQFSLRLKPLFFCLFCCVFSTVGYADDIEIYLQALEEADSGTGSSDPKKNPNVLFVLDTSGSMAAKLNGVRKMTTMKTALTNAVNGFEDINIGLARFNNNSRGGTILDAVKDVNVPANKEEFLNVLNGLNTGGGTPLSESMYEAYLYMSDGRLLQGQGRGGTDTDAVIGNPIVGAQYKSPIVDKCQVNSVVLLSDGFPSADGAMDGNIRNLPGVGNCNGNCMDELAGYMANNDIANHVPDMNPAYTYTIGFGLDIQLLKDTADAGAPPDAVPGAGYFNANNLTELENAFRAIAEQIVSVESETFVAPAVTVNTFSRLQYNDNLYYVVFKPSKTTRWNGNLKKYKVTAEGTIVDVNGDVAIDDDTGYFKEDARSFWSNSDDGHVVEDGGMADELNRNRKLYGNLDATSTQVRLLTKFDNAPSTLEFLVQTANHGVDIGATPGLTGIALQQNQWRIGSWTLGRDIDDELGNGSTNPNYFVGDSLHGSPYVLSYGTSAATPVDMIFFTSNQGMLHAVRGDTGKENWAYVPDPSLFKNFGEYFNNRAGKIYGLDSALSFSVERDSTNAVDKAHLFFGQRRGGNKVFAVDVTNADQSTNEVNKLWTISGDDSNFDRMGQTWAQPVVANVDYCNGTNCETKEVLFISGGYDEAYDDETANLADLSGTVKGNAIYMVDASDGSLLWMASSQPRSSMRDLQLNDMTHSIPSPPTVIDFDGDGISDYLFAVDIAGQVFRIDFRATRTDTSDISSTNNAMEVSGGMIADLTENGVNRRFYNPLDATILDSQRTASGFVEPRIALVTGSGYRAHPLEDESFDNRMYVIFDKNLLYPQFDTNGRPSYLYATTRGGTQRLIDMDKRARKLEEVNAANPLDAADEHKNGFFVKINKDKEKFLSSTLITNGRVFITSYLPEDPDAVDNSGKSRCTPAPKVGNSTLYSIALTGSGDISNDIVSTDLSKPGLAGTPTVVYIVDKPNPNGPEVLQPVIIVGTETFGGSGGGGGGGEECDPTVEDCECKPIPQNYKICPPNVGKVGKNAWWEEDRMN